MIEVQNWDSVKWVEGETYIQAPDTTYSGMITVGAPGVTLLGYDAAINGAGHPHCIQPYNLPGVTIKGFELYGSRNRPLNIKGHNDWQLNDFQGFVGQDLKIHNSPTMGIRIVGKNVKLINCEISDCVDDGIYAEGSNIEIAYTHIHDVDQGDRVTGDCIQWETGVSDVGGENMFVHHCLLDHSNKATKAALIFGGAGKASRPHNGRVEDSILIGGVTTLNFRGDNHIARNCVVKGMAGTKRVVNIERLNGAVLDHVHRTVPKGAEDIFRYKADNAVIIDD